MLIGVLGVRLPVPVFVRELLPPARAMSLLLCSLHQPLRGTVYLVLGACLVCASHHESMFISSPMLQLVLPVIRPPPHVSDGPACSV